MDAVTGVTEMTYTAVNADTGAPFSDNDTTGLLNTTNSTYSVFQGFRTQNEFYDNYTIMLKIDRSVTPIWWILGIPGNILSFMVWIQRRMRHSSGIYLAALSLFDCCFLLSNIVFELQETWDVGTMDHPFVCEGFPVFFLTFQYLSPLLVLAFTVERYISVCFPFKRDKYCTIGRATKVTILLITISFVLALVQGYFYIYDRQSGTCKPRPEALHGGTASIWSIWTWISEVLVFVLVPLVVLIFNILVIKVARKLSKSEAVYLNSKNVPKTSATTVMLLAVSFYLIIGVLPVTIVYALYVIFPLGDIKIPLSEVPTNPQWHRHFVYGTVRTTFEVFGMSHYACKFYIYCLTGKVFRKELRLLFQRVCCKKAYLAYVMRSRGTYTYELSDSRKQNGTCV
ncbi:growth hormone secretagogue receptor type 1-like [Tubulanus polymorphus]|uniref:growth hormone secretagogue receptor type 1-like n=1 Tax=Tubulanus polymorphus TaxID=672921 RepID=UPI003DA48B3C